MFGVFGRFPLVFGLGSYPPGPILESVFLWRASVDRNLPVTVGSGPPLKSSIFSGRAPEWSPTLSRLKNKIEGRPRGGSNRVLIGFSRF